MTAPTRLQPGGYKWNPTLARYIDPRGRIVAVSQVRSAIDTSLLAYAEQARRLAEQLRADAVSLRAWEAEMRVVVKDSQLLGAASAAGGWAQLDAESFGRAGRSIRDQYGFLDGFARDVASGKQKLDGSLANRAVMYVEAARSAYEAEREAIERAAGYDQEQSIRHASDSCEGCIREERRGWVAIGELVPIGDRDCLTRCRCTIERRRSPAAERRRRGPRIRRRTTVGT